jgi:integrase/recombinase XerD
MARPNPPHLSRDIDRHGNVRWYVRPPRRTKVRLREEYGTPAFWNSYQDALSGKTAATTKKSVDGIVPGSFRALCVKYYASPEFRGLDGSTKAWRRRALELVCQTKAALPVDQMESRHVRRLRDELSEKVGAANQRLKAIKALFSWATEAEEAKFNPARDVKLIKYKTTGHHSWTIEEVERFERHFPLGTKPRLAMALMLYTAGRREDAVRLGWKHIQNERIRFTQAKNEDRTPVEMDMPLHPHLRAAIDAGPCGKETFLVTEFGLPHTANGFGNWFREKCIEAGVPGRAHGLRKAMAARLAESQATAHEVMSITGHRTLEEVENYTRAARKPGMADSAMLKLQTSAAKIVPPQIEVGQEDEKDLIKQAPLAALALPRGLEPLFSP